MAAPRALLSVFHKDGIVELGKALHNLGWELLSTGGTSRALRQAGLPVIDVSDATGTGMFRRRSRPSILQYTAEFSSGATVKMTWKR